VWWCIQGNGDGGVVVFAQREARKQVRAKKTRNRAVEAQFQARCMKR